MIKFLLALVAALALSPAHASGKPLSISLSPAVQTVTEGQSATFLLSKSGGNGRVSAVKVTAGSWSASVVLGTSFSVPTVDDSIVNGTRTIVVTAVASTGATARATITELDNDVAPPPPTPTPTPPPPAPTPTGTTVLSEGDSISQFYGNNIVGGSHTGIYAATRPSVKFVGNAVGGSGLGYAGEPSPNNDLYVRQSADLAVNARVLTVLIGANNMEPIGQNYYTYQTPQAYADALFAWIAPFRAAGTKVAVGTVLPQCVGSSISPDSITNANRAVFNQIIRNAVGTKIDAVYDFAADPVMGPDAAACDTTLYKDGLHPTDFGSGSGQDKIEQIYAPVVDALLASAPPPAPTPVPPSPADAPGGVNNPLVGRSPGVGAPDIATTDHNVNNDLTAMQLAVPSAAGDPGAFRFICRHTNLAFDDPTVFYQQPGRSHLHDQTGVYGWSASSNYGNLRTGGGGSGCNDVAGFDQNTAESGWSANRTPYWQPALLDGKGNVIEVDFVEIYYKRRASTDPVVSDPTNPQYEGKAAPLPNGIKYIFGAYPDNSAKAPDTQVRFQCTSGASGAGYGEGSFADMIACAKAHSDGSLTVRIEGPSCWDGVNLDSADHRSHLAYASYGDWGYQKCDAAHPYVIPTYTYAAYYTILSSDTGDIHWASDEMDNSKPRGWSFHVDYGPAAWDPTVQAMWTNNCIEKLLSCVSGNLGNGLGLKGAAAPYYLVNGVWTALMRNPVRLVPVPAK